MCEALACYSSVIDYWSIIADPLLAAHVSLSLGLNLRLFGILGHGDAARFGLRFRPEPPQDPGKGSPGDSRRPVLSVISELLYICL